MIRTRLSDEICWRRKIYHSYFSNTSLSRQSSGGVSSEAPSKQNPKVNLHNSTLYGSMYILCDRIICIKWPYVNALLAKLGWKVLFHLISRQYKGLKMPVQWKICRTIESERGLGLTPLKIRLHIAEAYFRIFSCRCLFVREGSVGLEIGWF